jgi:hypothetical protein
MSKQIDQKNIRKFTTHENPYQILSEANLKVIGVKSGISQSEMSFYHGQ